MPTVANGIDLDWNLRQASGQNWEFELRKPLLGRLLPPDRKGVVRVLGYVNHAHMGLYRVANQAYLSGEDPTPEITKHETYGAVKYGFTLNAEQELTTNLRVFGRFGWNEGQHESYRLHRGGPDHRVWRRLLGQSVVSALSTSSAWRLSRMRSRRIIRLI